MRSGNSKRLVVGCKGGMGRSVSMGGICGRKGSWSYVKEIRRCKTCGVIGRLNVDDVLQWLDGNNNCKSNMCEQHVDGGNSNSNNNNDKCNEQTNDKNNDNNNKRLNYDKYKFIFDDEYNNNNNTITNTYNERRHKKRKTTLGNKSTQHYITTTEKSFRHKHRKNTNTRNIPIQPPSFHILTN